MNSKMIAHQKDFFSNMVVDAVSLLDSSLPLNMIGIKKVQGGSLEVRGVAEGGAETGTWCWWCCYDNGGKMKVGVT